MVWKASDGPVPLALKGSGAMLLPPRKKRFRFFPPKRHVQNSWDLKSVVKVWYEIWSLSYFSARNPKIKVHDWKGAVSKIVICDFSTYLVAWKSLLGWAFTKASHISSTSNLSEVWKALFTHRWSGARLDLFHERKGPLSFRTIDR